MSGEPRKLKRVPIKEELVELTGSFLTAIVLQQCIYWQERAKEFDAYFAQERQRAEAEGESIPDLTTAGWWYKSAKQMADDTMMGVSEATMRKYLTELINGGWLLERSNPKYKWDRTKQFRLDLVKVERDLAELGYPLDGYTGSSRSLIAESPSLRIKDGTAKNLRAIPETKTKTKTEGSSSRGAAQKINEVEDAQLLPSSGLMPPKATPGQPPEQVAQQFDGPARFAWRELRGNLKAELAAVDICNRDPSIWELLVEVKSKAQADRTTFCSWVPDVLTHIDAYGADKIKGDLKATVQKPRLDNPWAFFVAIAKAEQKPTQPKQRNGSRGSSRRGADENSVERYASDPNLREDGSYDINALMSGGGSLEGKWGRS